MVDLIVQSPCQALLHGHRGCLLEESDELSIGLSIQ